MPHASNISTQHSSAYFILIFLSTTHTFNYFLTTQIDHTHAIAIHYTLAMQIIMHKQEILRAPLVGFSNKTFICRHLVRFESWWRPCMRSRWPRAATSSERVRWCLLNALLKYCEIYHEFSMIPLMTGRRAWVPLLRVCRGRVRGDQGRQGAGQVILICDWSMV